MADVHLAIRNPQTDMIGCCYTPTSEVSTFCRYRWEERPRRTLRRDMVTCEACLRAPLKESTE